MASRLTPELTPQAALPDRPGFDPDRLAAFLHDVDARARRAMDFAMAETLARRHAVDVNAGGLADFGRPGNYFERQIARWSRQWHESRIPRNPWLERLVELLPEHVPATRSASALCHGDFRMGNLMFEPVRALMRSSSEGAA